MHWKGYKSNGYHQTAFQLTFSTSVSWNAAKSNWECLNAVEIPKHDSPFPCKFLMTKFFLMFMITWSQVTKIQNTMIFTSINSNHANNYKMKWSFCFLTFRKISVCIWLQGLSTIFAASRIDSTAEVIHKISFSSNDSVLLPTNL